MKTIITLIAVALIAFFYSSCNDEGSFINLPENQTARTELSFSGSATYTADTAQGPNDATRRAYTNDGSCTLIGDAEGYMDYVITGFNPSTGSGTIANGTGVLIDQSNGHKLYVINVAGSFQYYPDGHMTSTFSGDISGGTGRFVNASGSIEYQATVQADNSGVVTWTGQLGHGKPFGGELIGTLYPQSWNCGGGAGQFGRIGDGEGTLQHLANTSAALEFCVQYTPYNDGWVVNKGSNAVNTLTAENGDMVYLEVTGGTFKNTGQIVIYEGTPHAKVDGLYSFNIVGGTGRFANATGKIHSVGYALMSGLGDEAHAFSTWYGSWTY
jgi:hypothetical protein